jgi:hypothetical protein
LHLGDTVTEEALVKHVADLLIWGSVQGTERRQRVQVVLEAIAASVVHDSKAIDTLAEQLGQALKSAGHKINSIKSRRSDFRLLMHHKSLIDVAMGWRWNVEFIHQARRTPEDRYRMAMEEAVKKLSAAQAVYEKARSDWEQWAGYKRMMDRTMKSGTEARLDSQQHEGNSELPDGQNAVTSIS